MNWLIVVVFTVLGTACAHQPAGWQRASVAARDAAAHPSVWAPLLGAGAMAVDGLDQRITNTLSRTAPLYGDPAAAAEASDDLMKLATASAGLTALMVAVPDDQDAIRHRGEHLAVVLGGFAATAGITGALKDTVGRERPDHSDHRSFPSGHASQSFTAASLASANLHRRLGDDNAAHWADAGLYTVAGLTAWARVEAKVHYPSDVLVGAALGNFIGRFLDQLLLTDHRVMPLTMYLDGDTVAIGVVF
ncbi:MAG: phosphatase PAP2 family protein [Gammaproteobacteria bacterium]|nr:phosphatase PAP2 family protein [Gammaproteobacteria bacterium]